MWGRRQLRLHRGHHGWHERVHHRGRVDRDDHADKPADECTADKVGGELTMGMGLESLGLDPTKALGTGIAGATENTALYDTLMRYNPDDGEYEPHVAESLTPNDDFTQWTVKLHSGVKFGNGDALTSAAVKFSVERLAKASVAASGMAQEVVSIDTPDDLTAVFHLKRAWGGFPYFLSAEGGMVVNPTVVTAQGDNFSKNPKGAGVGPFEFEKFAPGEEIVLTAKPDYWDGPVCIEKLHFKWVPGGRATLDSFNTDQLQVFFTQEAPISTEAEAAGVEGFHAINGGNGFLMNSGRGTNLPLSDVRVRQAVAYAINVDTINERVLDGVGLPGSGITSEEQRVYGGPGPEYDPAKAKGLLEQAKAAGYNGNIRITCPDTSQAVDETITVQAMLQAVGFNVTVENLPSAQSNQKILIDGNYDLGCGSVSVFDAGPVRGINQFLSDSVRNRGGFKDPEFDKAIIDLYAANGEDEEIAAMEHIQELWNEKIPAVMFFATDWFVGHKDDVKGILPTREGTMMFQKAYIDS